MAGFKYKDAIENISLTELIKSCIEQGLNTEQIYSICQNLGVNIMDFQIHLIIKQNNISVKPEQLSPIISL